MHGTERAVGWGWRAASLRIMPAVRRSTRKSAGRTPAKYRPDEAEEEALSGQISLLPSATIDATTRRPGREEPAPYRLEFESRVESHCEALRARVQAYH